MKRDVLEANQDQPLSAEELEAVISVEKTNDLHRADFEDFFLFLWATSQEDLKKYFVLTFTLVLNNPLVVSKVKTLHDLHIGDEIVAQEKSDLSIDTIKTLIQENTMSILKMWELQSKDAHLPLAPEDKLVSKKRDFEKLSSNHQRLILIMHSDGSSVPSQACTTCIDILHAKTGPNVVNFLTCLLSNEDFALARGMAHNLGHAQVFSKTPSEIDTFLCPPQVSAYCQRSQSERALHN